MTHLIKNKKDDLSTFTIRGNVVITVNRIQCVAIQLKATEQDFHVILVTTLYNSNF